MFCLHDHRSFTSSPDFSRVFLSFSQKAFQNPSFPPSPVMFSLKGLPLLQTSSESFSQTPRFLTDFPHMRNDLRAPLTVPNPIIFSSPFLIPKSFSDSFKTKVAGCKLIFSPFFLCCPLPVRFSNESWRLKEFLGVFFLLPSEDFCLTTAFELGRHLG